MATPANRFEQVEQPRSDAVSVTLWRREGQACGRVLGPHEDDPDRPPLVVAGTDDPLTAHEALAVACVLANESHRTVVVIDPDGVWRAEWGRLVRTWQS